MTDSGTTLPLLGKTALITGSARGIGAAVAWKLASEGADIIIHHLTESSSDRAANLATRICNLAHKPAVFTFRADISSPTGPIEIVAALKEWRAPSPLVIDILVNNAGIAPPAILADVTPEHITSVLATNLQGPLLMTQAVEPHLRPKARIVNISSIAARQTFRGLTVYGASKAGLEAVTRHLAHELGGNGTTVNCVTPGTVDSELLWETEKLIPGVVDGICKNTPLEHRVGTPEEFASVVAWVCRPEAGWITGQVISATGGQALY
ncbi:hypothetical protein VDGD_07401 [Verticillium dahliae]|nr:hypothetical protein VdG1_03103 [Verticillium dahliae VDG1]RBQ98847.1 hypothetical protein VDGD_07401 [Verticillium dahliae]